MDRKEDRRVTMTKRMLKDALIGMLRDTDIYHISIRDLCRRADVNRTTFYKYYGSQFDLLADMEKDLLDFLSNAITEHADDPVRIIETACGYMESHLEFGRLIINNNVDPLFPQKLFSQAAVREAALKKYGGQKDAAELEYLFNFITYGAYRVVCVWLNKEDREPPRQIARQMIRLIQME
ncbi:MAG: TetR/AcrR family transcriptional regulator [Clostridia bacterium]|nr:TetR/AcrR family transcriptional regulator [Clostridia bacterium]